MTKEVDRTERAQRDLNNLEQQRETLFCAAKSLSTQRDVVAFTALTTKDKQAQTRLAEINAEDIALTANVASVEAALVVARTNLAAAQADAAKAADRAQAHALRKVVAEWRDRAANVDAAFADIHSDLIAMQDLHNRMLALGSRFPSHQQFNVLGLLALKTALMGTPIWSREFEHLAPNQRRKFKDLIDGWAATIESGIAARLGSKEAA